MFSILTSANQGKKGQGVSLVQDLIEGCMPAVDHYDADLFFGQSKTDHDPAAVGSSGVLLPGHLESAVSERGKQFDDNVHGTTPSRFNALLKLPVWRLPHRVMSCFAR